MPNRLLKNLENRLLTRAAQKRSACTAITYRAATVRERCGEPPFQQPASVVLRKPIATPRGNETLIGSHNHKRVFVKFYAGFGTFVRRRELPDNRMAEFAVLRIRDLL
jgi:hypothetical protein